MNTANWYPQPTHHVPGESPNAACDSSQLASAIPCHFQHDELDSLIQQLHRELDTPRGPETHTCLLSFVIPIRDEQQTLRPLCELIRAQIPPGFDHEIILVDDGSRDDTWPTILQLTRQCSRTIRGIKLRHNAGKAIALTVGFRAAKGNVVFTLDADLQDDPREIPRFLAKLDEGFDLVSGWKRVRHDPWHKVLPSRVFNHLTSRLGGVSLHDHNCGFKCYRAELTRGLFLFGEMHRMVPSLAGMQGFRCAEIEVRHHPRRTGISKYGWERFLRGLSDAVTVGFLRRFRQRPAHWFNALAGIVAIVTLTTCLTIGLVGSADRLLPWMLATGGVQLAVFCVLNGLLAEMIVRGPLNATTELPVEFDTGLASYPRQPGSDSDSRPLTHSGPPRAAAGTPPASQPGQSLFHESSP